MLIVDNFVVVPEEQIIISQKKYIEELGNEPNDFSKILESGELYRQAGLTPLYLYGETTGLHVTANEYANREITFH